VRPFQVARRLEAEILVMRHQLNALQLRAPRRLCLTWADRALFVWLYRGFPRILDAITILTPETIVRWHRKGFAAFWRWKSRSLGGRPQIDKEVRDLIRRMSFDNPLWGAPHIHGELLKLGFDVAPRSTASVPRVSPERAARSPFSMQRYVAPWPISACAISPRSAATMSSCRDRFHHSVRRSSGATRIVCVRKPSTLPSHDSSYGGSEQFEFVSGNRSVKQNLNSQSLARAGELDSQNGRLRNVAHLATSVPGLMTAQAGAHHARLYCKPLSYIAWLMKKARSFI
jgi:hypothetical protein